MKAKKMTKKKNYWPKERKFNGKTFHLSAVTKNKTQAKKLIKRSQNPLNMNRRVVSGKKERFYPYEKGKNRHQSTAKKGRGAVYTRMKEGPLRMTSKGKTYR